MQPPWLSRIIMRKAVLDRGELKLPLPALEHRAARLSRPPQARRSRCLDSLVELCYMVTLTGIPQEK